MSTTSVPPPSWPTPPLAERARGRNRALRRLRSAKIVATLGPASESPERLRALFDAGVDVFRLNFSHGTHAEKRLVFENIRHVESDTGPPIGILADLHSPNLPLAPVASGSSTTQ